MPDNSPAAAINDFAQDIRTVDGSHSLGAAALAEALYDLGYRKIPKPGPFKRGELIQNSDIVPPGTRVIGRRGELVYEVIETRMDRRWLQGRLRDIRSGRSVGWQFLDSKQYVIDQQEES